MSAHRRYRRLIRDCFADELTGEQQAALLQHLRQCDDCRAEYDLAATMLRAAAGRSPTRQEEQRWDSQLLARISGQTGEPQAAPRRARLPWLAPLAATLLVLIAVGVWLGRGKPNGRPGVQLRGGDGVVAPLVDLEVFAIDADRHPPTPRRIGQGGTVRLDEYLQFRYRNHSTRVRHLYLLGLDSRSEMLDYFPRPDESQSIAIEEALGPRAVARSIRLAQRHRPGTLWIYAVFSEEPLTRAEVHRKIQHPAVGGRRMDFGQGIYVVLRQITIADKEGP